MVLLLTYSGIPTCIKKYVIRKKKNKAETVFISTARSLCRLRHSTRDKELNCNLFHKVRITIKVFFQSVVEKPDTHFKTSRYTVLLFKSAAP